MSFHSPYLFCIATARFGAGQGPIYLDDVRCSGHESSLQHCSTLGVGVHNCAHSDDAGVACFDSMFMWI